MRILRTPEECFADLPEYPFPPHYAVVPDGEGGTLRVHYVDVGPRRPDPIVFVHGNPTWSYVWRNVLPPVAAAGYRAIAVDLVGMGRSDKPSEMSDFSVARHVEWMRATLLDALGLDSITLVLHDWGGIIGLRLLGDDPDRIARVCLSNTGLFLRDPADPILPADLVPSGPWVDFQRMVRETPDWHHWKHVQQLTLRELPREILDAYRAPYPKPEYISGNRQFTQMLATTADNEQLPGNWRAWQVIQRFQRPFVTIVTETDPICGGGHKPFLESVPGARGQPHRVIPGGSHFFQEDVPEEYTRALIDWLRSSD